MPVDRSQGRRTEVARAKLTEIAEEADEAETEATRMRHRKFRAMLKAFDSGLTYSEIADITGLSNIRVSQVLTEQRALKATSARNGRPKAKRAGR